MFSVCAATTLGGRWRQAENGMTRPVRPTSLFIRDGVTKPNGIFFFFQIVSRLTQKRSDKTRLLNNRRTKTRLFFSFLGVDVLFLPLSLPPLVLSSTLTTVLRWITTTNKCHLYGVTRFFCFFTVTAHALGNTQPTVTQTFVVRKHNLKATEKHGRREKCSYDFQCLLLRAEKVLLVCCSSDTSRIVTAMAFLGRMKPFQNRLTPQNRRIPFPGSPGSVCENLKWFSIIGLASPGIKGCASKVIHLTPRGFAKFPLY